MVTMAQRIEQLREEKGLSRPAFAAALGLPKNAPEKFETGRATPTKEQQDKMADFFGVSLFYLKGESSDRTRMDAWLEGDLREEGTDHVPMKAAAPKPKSAPSAPPAAGGVLDAFLDSPGFRELVRKTLTEVLRSPEGEEIIAKVVRKELLRQK